MQRINLRRHHVPFGRRQPMKVQKRPNPASELAPILKGSPLCSKDRTFPELPWAVLWVIQATWVTAWGRKRPTPRRGKRKAPVRREGMIPTHLGTNVPRQGAAVQKVGRACAQEAVNAPCLPHEEPVPRDWWLLPLRTRIIPLHHNASPPHLASSYV